MRSAGEYKFAGGTRDSGESLLECAVRELVEEFMLDEAVQQNATLRYFRKHSTRPVKGRSYNVNNFIALEQENSWLQQLDISGEFKSNRKHILFQDVHRREQEVKFEA